MDFQPLGKFLIGAGFLCILVGLLMVTGKGFGWMGRLPGDVRIERPHFSFYFPIVTCLVLSVAGSLILWLLSRFR